MEDFRNKIKNYKASSNDQAWEKMLIKKEKRGIKKTKTFLYTLLALNAAAIIFWSLYTWNATTTEESKITETKITEITTDNKNSQIDDAEFNNLKEQNKNRLENINTLSAENDKLKNEISQLQRTIINKQFRITQLANQLQTSLITTRINPPVISKVTENTSQEPRLEKVDPVINNTLGFVPLPSKSNSYVQNYLLDLASGMKPTIPYFYNETIINDAPIRKWYLSVGTNYENLVEDSQRSLVTGLHRSLNKRFDVGVLVEFSKTQERTNYRIDNDIKDHRTETIGQLIVRYNALRFKNFLLHADAGIGYRFGSIVNRRSKVVSNMLEYYGEASDYRGIDYQFALGAMYQISPQFNLGARFYIDRGLHTNINLNYRF